MPDQFLISTDKSLLDMDTIYAFLSTCYWSPGIARSRVERAIENSMCFGIHDTETAVRPLQIGFARVITDKATYGYICDVFVLEEYRGRGL